MYLKSGGIVLVFTERLKKERKEKGLTYEEMANMLGYKSKSTYRYIELGITIQKLNIVTKISSILEKPISYFFNLEVQENYTNDQTKNQKDH